MKVIVAGSRSITSKPPVKLAIEKAPFRITELVSGGAKGVDQTAEQMHSDVITTVFEADWDKYGDWAGPIRNQKMAAYADALIAVWDGESRGTENMIREAINHGLDIYVTHHETQTI